MSPRLMALAGVVLLFAATACGPEEDLAGPPAAGPPAASGPRALVLNDHGDSIQYVPGWTVDGPDAAGTVSMANGEPDAFEMVTVRQVPLESPGETVAAFSARLADGLRESLGPFARMVSSAAGGADSDEWLVQFWYGAGDGGAGGVERQMIRQGAGYAITGAWGPNSSSAAREEVRALVDSFIPAATSDPGLEPADAPRVRYPEGAGVHAILSKLSLGHYIALDDASLWEVALADRLLAMKLADHSRLRIEPQEDGALYPYALADPDGDARLDARYVGRGEGIIP